MSLERIEVTPFPLLLAEIITGRKSGALTVIREPFRKTLHFSAGELSLITSNSIQESLGAYLFSRSLIGEELALRLTPEDWTDSVPLFHEGGFVDLKQKDVLLREWLLSLALPLFSLVDGTAIFSGGEPLPPVKRVFIKSTPLFVLDGIRSIRNGLVLRRSLGDIERRIEPTRDPLFSIASLPLNEREMAIARALKGPEPIESFIRRVGGDSAGTARVVITMLTLGLFATAPEPPVGSGRIVEDDHDTQADLMLLASIGSDPRSLEVISLARQLPMMNHYQFLGIPRRATQSEIIKRAGEMRKRFNPTEFQPIVQDSVRAIRKRIDEASSQLQDPAKRQHYDGLLTRADKSHHHGTIQQKLTRRSIGEQNYERATKLAARGDYYGAIVLLKQAVDFAPDHADAWFLLGSCQERNPQWHRHASESLQKALSIDPNHIDALIALGDLYRAEGLTSRAESCWEDVLQIDETNRQALKRLGRKRMNDEGGQ